MTARNRLGSVTALRDSVRFGQKYAARDSIKNNQSILTSFWFTVLDAEDLSVMGLHLQDLLHAAQVMNPAGDRITCFKGWSSPQSGLTPSFSLRSYLSIPLRSPDARCWPSGLTQMLLMPVLLSAVCPSPCLSALVLAAHSGSSRALVFLSM